MSAGLDLNALRSAAWEIQRACEVTHCQALDRVATAHGFRCWSDLVTAQRPPDGATIKWLQSPRRQQA